WPASFVVDPTTGAALVFCYLEETLPTGSFAFHSVGTSIATWASPDQGALRPAVRTELADPTVLFPADEPPWGAAALVDGTDLYAWACPGGHLSAPCRIARAPVAAALDHDAWRYFDGRAWVTDWRAATNVLEGAPLMSVHFNGHLQAFIALYMDLGGTM